MDDTGAILMQLGGFMTFLSGLFTWLFEIPTYLAVIGVVYGIAIGFVGIAVELYYQHKRAKKCTR